MRAGEVSRERAVHDVLEDIEKTRADLGVYLSELDRRRHDALDWRLLLRRHRGAITVLGVAVTALAGLGVAAAVKKRRRRRWR